MKIDNTTNKIMFTSELDVLRLSQGAANEKVVLKIYNEDYQYLLCTMSLYTDKWGKIVIPGFGELLNDLMRMDMGNIGIYYETPSELKEMLNAMFIPVRVKTAEPAVTYINFYPLQLYRGKKTAIAGFSEYMTVILTAGTWKLHKIIRFHGETIEVEEEKVVAAGYEKVTMVMDADAEFRKANRLPPATYEGQMIAVKVTEPMKQIGVKIEFTRAPYGATCLGYVNAFGAPDTMPIAHVERKSKPVVKTAQIGGQLVTYENQLETTYEVKSLPLRDGEQEAAADFLHALEAHDMKSDMKVVIKEGELKVKSDANEMWNVVATVQTNLRLPSFDGRKKRIFDETFDTTFE